MTKKVLGPLIQFMLSSLFTATHTVIVVKLITCFAKIKDTRVFSAISQFPHITSTAKYEVLLGGFPIKIETEISWLISYSFAIFIV